MRLLTIIALASGAASCPVSVWAQERSWDLPPAIWAWGASGVAALVFLFSVWALLHLVPLILAIVVAVLGIRWLVTATRRMPSDRAIQVLRERYARGEIGKEEFEAKMRDLSP